VSAQVAGAMEQTAARVVERAAVLRGGGRLLGDEPADAAVDADAPSAAPAPEFEVYDDGDFYEQVRACVRACVCVCVCVYPRHGAPTHP
jgi:hypothetical protein